MDAQDVVTYCNLMAEVKGRIAVLEAVYTKKINLGSDLARFEFSALLLRKSLEQVALASLVSNRAAISAAYKHFSDSWNARLIVRDIERINPQFYPVPIDDEAADSATGNRHITQLKDGYLTKDDFVKAYDKCAALLHAPNPYGSAPDLKYFDKQLPIWRYQLFRLLDRHYITLAGDANVYLIHMHEADGKVHHYTMSPLESVRGG